MAKLKVDKSRRESNSADVQLLIDFDADCRLPPATSLGIRESASAEFAERIAALLESDRSNSLDNGAISNLARDFFGTAAGHARDAYDATEAGFNLYLKQIEFNASNVQEGLKTLIAEQARLPRQNKRDHRQIELQQFSSPPPLGLVLVDVAGVEKGMAVLEPSAGTGNLAILAKLRGARVDTNEIDEKRRELLELLGFEPTTLDAERLDNLLEAQKRYDVVVMNPPFSATGGRVNGHNSAFGARHLEQALLRLKPGGRLAAIVGRGMALDRPGFRKWWTEQGKKYRIRANVGIDGREYGKFGTTFDVQLIVIDNDGHTSSTANVVVGSRLSVSEAWELLRPIAIEDISERIRDKGKEKKTHRNGFGHARQCKTVESVSVNGRSDVRRRSPLFDLEPVAKVDSPLPPQQQNLDESIGELDTSFKSQLVDIEEGSVFASYRVQKAVVRGAHEHPANIVESTAMACVEPPDVHYKHHLPREVIAEGRISDLQIEDVIYAGQATETVLPDGSCKGHWNGDGTGLGKGRELYAFIYNEYQQGRQKHVHISASHQLGTDAERDRDALGLPLDIIHQSRLKVDEAISEGAGVVFTTYTMLSNDFGGKRRRFNQLTDWLDEDFSGVIGFDEAHLMKNAAATPHGGKATVDQGTLRGNMGITLQRMFPKARVRYFSATGATEARHMAPYERLGLWGPGAPFADFQSFLVAMEQGGVAAMEMLCRDLKSVGTYLSRTISYGPSRTPEGEVISNSAVEYAPLVHRLSEAESKQYNDIADLWSELLLAFETAEGSAGQSRNGSRYAQFYSAQQRFFLQLMMTYTLPDLIPAIEKDLREDRSVVLSLFNTGEAQTKRKVQHARAHGIELSELDATPREMIVQLIENHFPIYQYTEQTDPVTGNVVRVQVLDEDGNPEINRENQRRQEALIDKVADIDFPQNPLDALIGHFRTENVAEISGRNHRFENGKYVRRKLRGVSRKELNAHETKLFQDGEKRIAVISGAGSTGISTHADVQARNQQRRVFYAFQLSWSADQQMQAFGRVHRSNQTSAPIIRLVLIDLAGQKRLVNAVSKRLAALGAITKGERHSLSSDLFRPEDVTDEFGKAALSALYREIQINMHSESGLGLPVLDRMGVLNAEKTVVRDSYRSNVEQFLNRIMVLHVQEQNRLFELFYKKYLMAVDAAKQQGAFDFGVEEIRATNLRRNGDPETVFVDEASGARTLLHELEGQVRVTRNSFTDACRERLFGFYRNRHSGRIYATSMHWNSDRNDLLLTSVRGKARSVELTELHNKYEEVSESKAKVWWQEEYENTPATEARRYHVLSGALFPIYDRVMGRSGIQNAKIARARLADGESIVGLRLSSLDVPQVKQRLGIGTPLAQASAEEVINLVVGGAVIELDNGWRLRRNLISGDRVIELVLSGVPANRDELVGYGLVEEMLDWKRRWFVALEDACAVLSALLAHRKAIEDHSLEKA